MLVKGKMMVTGSYYCSTCRQYHRLSSNVGKEHYSTYLLEEDRIDKLADEKRLTEKKPSKEEIDRRLYKAIFGENV